MIETVARAITPTSHMAQQWAGHAWTDLTGAEGLRAGQYYAFARGFGPFSISKFNHAPSVNHRTAARIDLGSSFGLAKAGRLLKVYWRT